MKPIIQHSILLLAILLSACAPKPEPSDCARPQVFCAGLVTDFGGVDSGISHEAWLGLQDAHAAGLANRVDYIATVDARDQKANIATLASEGYDVIVTVGYSMSEETTAAAEKYSKVSFIGIQQPQAKKVPNLAGLVFHEEQSGFLAGAAAGLQSETGHVAAICDARFVDSMRRYCEGFKAGALYVNPKIAASVTFREGPNDKLFNDPNWGRSTALQQLQEGSDVIFAAGGNTAIAALEAAAAEGAYVIGSETDLYGDFADLRPLLLTSALSDVRQGVLDLVRQAKAGALPSGDYIGSVSLAPWHDLDPEIPSETKQELELIKIRLAVGSIPLDVPYISAPESPTPSHKPRKTPRPTKTP